MFTARPRELRDRLHSGRSGADESDAEAGELLEVLTRDTVVPAGGVEGLALEDLEAVDHSLRELRLGERSVRANDKLGLDVVAAVRADVPDALGRVPGRGLDGRAEDGELVEVEVVGDLLAVAEDLRALREVAARDELQLVEQREVVVRADVARDARVPVPCARIMVTRPLAPLYSLHTVLRKVESVLQLRSALCRNGGAAHRPAL